MPVSGETNLVADARIREDEDEPDARVREDEPGG